MGFFAIVHLNPGTLINSFTLQKTNKVKEVEDGQFSLFFIVSTKETITENICFFTDRTNYVLIGQITTVSEFIN